MAAQAIPIKGEAEFTVKKESWSKYDVLDGQGVVWVRAVLVKLLELDTSKLGPGVAGNQYIVSTQTIVTAFFKDPKLKGEPKPITPEEFATGGQEIDFDRIDEPWNEYVIAGKHPRLIRTKCVATGIWYFPDRHNDFGDPVVRVNSQVVVGAARAIKPEEAAHT